MSNEKKYELSEYEKTLVTESTTKVISQKVVELNDKLLQEFRDKTKANVEKVGTPSSSLEALYCFSANIAVELADKELKAREEKAKGVSLH